MSNNLPPGADTNPLNPSNIRDYKKYRTVRVTVDLDVWATEEDAPSVASASICGSTGAVHVDAYVLDNR